MVALTNITGVDPLPDPTETGDVELSNPRRIILVPNLLESVLHPHNRRIISRAVEIVNNRQTVSI